MTFYVNVTHNLLFIKGFLVEYGRRPHALRCEPLNKNDPIVEEKGSYDRANGTHTRRGSGSGGTGGASVSRGGVARSREISSSLTCVGSLPLFLSLHLKLVQRPFPLTYKREREAPRKGGRLRQRGLQPNGEKTASNEHIHTLHTRDLRP